MAMRLCTEPGCDRKHQARGYCGSHYNSHFPNPNPQAPIPCTVCGTLVMKDKRDHAKRQPVCSVMCRTKLQTGHWPMCLVSERPKPRKPQSAPRRDPFVPTLRACDWCGQLYIARSRRSRFDRINCNWSAKQKRRGNIRVASAVEIFERDRWMCKLCNKPTARTKKVPHPKAPTVDHIVPRSLGGDLVDPANLQCAHMVCNSRKGNRAANEQLMLFGSWSRAA